MYNSPPTSSSRSLASRRNSQRAPGARQEEERLREQHRRHHQQRAREGPRLPSLVVPGLPVRTVRVAVRVRPRLHDSRPNRTHLRIRRAQRRPEVLPSYFVQYLAHEARDRRAARRFSSWTSRTSFSPPRANKTCCDVRRLRRPQGPGREPGPGRVRDPFAIPHRQERGRPHPRPREGRVRRRHPRRHQRRIQPLRAAAVCVRQLRRRDDLHRQLQPDGRRTVRPGPDRRGVAMAEDPRRCRPRPTRPKPHHTSSPPAAPDTSRTSCIWPADATSTSRPSSHSWTTTRPATKRRTTSRQAARTATSSSIPIWFSSSRQGSLDGLTTDNPLGIAGIEDIIPFNVAVLAAALYCTEFVPSINPLELELTRRDVYPTQPDPRRGCRSRTPAP